MDPVVFERRDVWELSVENPWHPIIEWYARAVTAMQGRDGPDVSDPASSSDPTSWRHLAAIHGTFFARDYWPDGATWNECQHNSWFFLPWHRIYLHYFEIVVRQTVADLNGPSDWALPYWNYSDPGRPDVRKLPPAFREPQMPSGDPNPLFVSERDPRINQGGELDPRIVNTGDAMAEPYFTGPAVNRIAEFGGSVTGWNHAGGTVGSLEATPHGTVHVGVGGINPLGLMSQFETAARDPIFWLHHANIDRLWEAWLGQSGRANPTQDGWVNMWFKVGGGASGVTLTVRDVLDTRQPPLSYYYSDVSVPVPRPEAVLARSATESLFAEEEPMPQDIILEMVGGSEDRVPLAVTPTEAEVAIEAPSGPAVVAARAEGAQQPRKVYMKVENVTGKELAAPVYLVYINLPPEADPAAYEDRRAGQVSMFGVREASESNEEHSGSGLSFSFDITGVVQRLQDTGEWDPERLRVTFTPVGAGAAQSGDVSVGRVSLFYA